MLKNKAIPEGYMTVGAIAKKMGVTVRTMQYYDREGLLSPSAESEGGRRLYTDKDVIKLHQILSMKHLGFTLEDIKEKLKVMETPLQVAKALTSQAAAIREQIEKLTNSLQEIETLKDEVLQMQSVDFKRYADIIINLQMKNDFYWMIKYFDDDVLEHCRNTFDQQSGMAIMDHLKELFENAALLQKEGVLPESEKGQEFAKEFWDLIMEFTGGDMSMLSSLIEMNQSVRADSKWKDTQTILDQFMSPALDAYFTKQGMNPLKEGAK